MYISEVGGSEFVVPSREIDFHCACVCVAYVLAKLRGREMLSLWLGVAGCNLLGSSAPLSGIWSVPPVPRKTTPLFFVRLLIAASRCFPLLPVASHGFWLLPVASRARFCC